MGRAGWFSLFVLVVLTSGYLVGSHASAAVEFFPTECGQISPKVSTLSNKSPKTEQSSGSEAKQSSWPWMALVGYKPKKDSKPVWFRFGTLITTRHVLTVANAGILLKPSIVRLGDHDLSKPGETKIQDIEVENFTQHEDFNMSHFFKNQGKADIGILLLAEEAIISESSGVAPICLPFNGEVKPAAGTRGWVAGWGGKAGRGITDILHEGNVTISESSRCDSATRKTDAPRKLLKLSPGQHLCATDLDKNARGSCEGDYGSPLVAKKQGDKGHVIHYLIGIASFGVNCAKKTAAVEVFVNTSAYIDWIKAAVKRDLRRKHVCGPGQGHDGKPKFCLSLPEDCGTRKKGTRKMGLVPNIARGITAEKNSWPWLALMGYGEGRGRTWGCGGVLITSWHVLTAAHCASTDEPPREVRLGEHTVSDRSETGVQNIKIKAIYSHEKYSTDTHQHDIAIVKLVTEAVLDGLHVAPVCLPVENNLQESDFVGVEAVVAGWGKTTTIGDGDKKIGSYMLKQAHVNVTSYEDCHANLQTLPNYAGELVKDSHLCAWAKETSAENIFTFCRGDSGSPLMVTKKRPGSNQEAVYAIGIVSIGPEDCGAKEYHGIYVRVTTYVAWIQGHLYI